MYDKRNTLPEKTTEHCTYCFVQVNDATLVRHFSVELLITAQRGNLAIFLTPVLKKRKVGRFPNFGQTVFMQLITFLSSIINQTGIRATSLLIHSRKCVWYLLHLVRKFKCGANQTQLFFVVTLTRSLYNCWEFTLVPVVSTTPRNPILFNL